MANANGPPSEAPIMSMIAACGIRSIKLRFNEAENVAPVDTTRRTLDRSYGTPANSAFSSSATIGRANASPTMDNCVTRSRCTSVNSSLGSNFRPPSMTTLPPRTNVENAKNNAVPCMSGGAVMLVGLAPDSANPTAISVTCCTVVGSGMLSDV